MLKFYKGLSSKEIVLSAATSESWGVKTQIQTNIQRLAALKEEDDLDLAEDIEFYEADIKDLKEELKIIQDAIKEVKG